MAYYEQRFLSMAPSEVLVSSSKGFAGPTVQAQLEELVQWLEASPAVNRCLSVADLIRDKMPMWLVRGTGAIGGLLSKERAHRADPGVPGRHGQPLPGAVP